MIEWEMQDRGWYTSDLGGICKERNGWWFYPKLGSDAVTRGPFKTLREAQDCASPTPLSSQDGRASK